MYQIYLSRIFDKDSHTKEIVKSYFNNSYDDFYEHLEAYLSNFHPSQSIALGKQLYKCDFSPPDYNKGARKSYRLIIAFIQVQGIIIPVKIYKKSKTSNIAKNELLKILESMYREMKIK